jgi:hypothetical protein
LKLGDGVVLFRVDAGVAIEYLPLRENFQRNPYGDVGNLLQMFGLVAPEVIEKY